ncbi:hypothetical protein K3495_g4241 [Podosphaera aphanis]|nr:hypothetical protein K3495_g4241 [Podosphaera aphanis]
MDLNEVVTYGQNHGARAKCTQLVAAAITRVFSYTIQAELEYGCIWTGKAIIFLRLPENPRTILNHLSVPKEDVGETIGWSEGLDVNNKLQLMALW